MRTKGSKHGALPVQIIFLRKFYVMVLNVEQDYMNYYVKLCFGSSQGMTTGEMRVCSMFSTSDLESRNQWVLESHFCAVS